MNESHAKNLTSVSSDKAAVFIMLGQSNAVGHGIPMNEADKITEPLKNVFGLSRELNQSFTNTALHWRGYTSFGMNLAEEQDHTYSVPNQLAKLWQEHIDSGNELSLPDLYIIQIAIGAQGVTEGYMWHPSKEEKLIPGKLGTVDISLFPFTCHIFSLIEKNMKELNKDCEVIGLHWRGGSNDITCNAENFTENLEDIYCTIFDSFNSILNFPPTYLHRLIIKDRTYDIDPTGVFFDRMNKINSVFDSLCKKYGNFQIFDPQNAPMFNPHIRGNGLYIDDAIHFTPEANKWVAETVIKSYTEKEQS